MVIKKIVMPSKILIIMVLYGALIACAISARKLAGTTNDPLGEEKTFLPFPAAAKAGVGGTAGIGGSAGLGGVGGAFGGGATGGLDMGSSFGGGDGTGGPLGGTPGLGGFGLGGQIVGGFDGGFGDRLP